MGEGEEPLQRQGNTNSTEERHKLHYLLALKKNELVYVEMQDCMRSFFPLASCCNHISVTTK